MAKNSIARQSKSQLKLEIGIASPVRRLPAVNATGSRSTMFRRQLATQLILLPADFKSRLPDNHFVFFIIDMVSRLDLSGILVKYEKKSRVGRPAYDPIMMLTLKLYCYCTGTTSARAIERLCRENVPCCVITGNQVPDHDTISDYLLLHREQFDSISTGSQASSSIKAEGGVSIDASLQPVGFASDNNSELVVDTGDMGDDDRTEIANDVNRN